MSRSTPIIVLLAFVPLFRLMFLVPVRHEAAKLAIWCSEQSIVQASGLFSRNRHVRCQVPIVRPPARHLVLFLAILWSGAGSIGGVCTSSE